MLCSILFSTERIKGDEKVELQQRRTIVTGALLLSNIMAGMDGTIVNTALPAITSDLHGLQYMGWIIATFLFGMAVATPLWSKFGEHKGNKQAYITATSMFLVGAIFQGLAPNILWFIIARTVMGIGAGGMIKVDSKAVDPIVPSSLFKNRELVIDFTLFVIIWGSFIAFVTYIPMWAQGILGLSALLGGMTQIPGAVTNFIGSELVPVLQERWGKYWMVTCGAASIFIAYLGIMIGGQKTPFWLILFMGAFEGFGVGLVFNILQINVQTDAELRDVPIATSLGYLLRILSQTLMSAVYGVIINQELFQGVQTHHGITLRMLNKLSNAQTASSLPDKLLPTLRTILYNGYRDIIIAAVILILIALVLVVVLGWQNHCHQRDLMALGNLKDTKS